MNTALKIRRADDRGHANHGWLDTHHTFSFAGYYDPRFEGFRALRVLNDDRVSGGGGFGSHPHRDMDIVTVVLDGALEHKDSMGTGSVIRPGDVQRMSAGTGVVHSEYNHSKQDPVRLLQIWIIPGQRGVEPSYEQRYFAPEDRRGRLALIASGSKSDDAVSLSRDARIYSALIESDDSVTHEFAADRYGWIQIARGEVRVQAETLREGDGVAISGGGPVVIEGVTSAELLLFDLD